MDEQIKTLNEIIREGLKSIKPEPVSDEEQDVPHEYASGMRKRKLSDPVTAESYTMRFGISDPPQHRPNESKSSFLSQYQGSDRSNFPAPSVRSRDPRLAKKTFLDGGLTTGDLIRSSDPVPESSLTHFQRNVLRNAHEMRKQHETRQSAFSANIPRGPRIPDELAQQRSPAIISSRNPLFMSQATKENVRDATQRYPNNPNIAIKSGDSDEISRAIQPPKEVQNSNAQRQESTRAERKTFADKKVQTTKNTGGFSIIIDDLNDLTPEQRTALVEFKNVMNCKDESSTDAILERSAHRRADRARKQSMERSFNRNDTPARSDSYVNQDVNISRNANPPGSSSSSCRNWTPK